MDNGLSIADAMALNQNKDDGFLQGNGILIILFFLIFFGGNGFGGFGNNATQNALTQTELQRGFDTNTIVNKLDGISNGICDSTYALNNSIKDGNSALQLSLCNGFNGVNNSITTLGYELQKCCCETNRNIDAVRYENAQNTCEITKAIHHEGEQTRALINANTMQNLRDQLTQAQGVISNSVQSQTILNSLGRYVSNPPCPLPCYCGCGTACNA